MMMHDVSETSIFNTLTSEDYLHGRCHLFALVLADLLNTPIQYMIDNEPMFDSPDQYECWIEDGSPLMLVHAYVEIDGVVMDAAGVGNLKYIIDQYGEMATEPEVLVVDSDFVHEMIDEGRLVNFYPGEREAIEHYIRSTDDFGIK